ncbi:hypothetical protein CQA66_04225 [Helicobacter aurati]|uniref:Uncharacterized protein n=1 Tax=Helicobacter aurati TaxID=137778 RepID=A0A3D8J5T5_9HELI|nr:hypothetical protein [Helicobacter aurati]RDU72525.1 hypothetical protein CQA66_04225 [Helicobacter aurati]
MCNFAILRKMYSQTPVKLMCISFASILLPIGLFLCFVTFSKGIFFIIWYIYTFFLLLISIKIYQHKKLHSTSAQYSKH